MKPRCYTLTVACPDRVGIVAAVSNFLAQHQGWIVEASHHADQTTGFFFMRQQVLADSLGFDLQTFCRLFSPIAQQYQMQWHISDSGVKKRAAILVSKHDHCLADLLYRWRNQEFDFEIACVISNHDDLRSFVEWHGIAYHHVPVTPDNRPQAFAKIDELYQQYNADVMVLARYMQILPVDLCRKYAGQIINIHHSFLPSFAGARPYHQAYERGVKLIGATCHYVTEDLDEGPIIDQDVIRVDHGDSVEEMMRLGRDVEKMVLARGLQWHVEDRVLIHQHKTVVFT